MKSDNYRTLSLYVLPFLYKNRARKINEKDLLKGVANFIRESNFAKLYSTTLYEDFCKLLFSLQSLKLLTLNKKTITVSKKFTLILPLVRSRSGYFFVDDKESKVSLFILAENSLGGMHDDLVEVLPIRFSKKGLEGKVLRIEKEHCTFLLAKIIGFQKKEGEYIISILNLNSPVLGLLFSDENFYLGDTVVVEKDIDKSFKKTFLSSDILDEFPNSHPISYLKCFFLYLEAYQKFDLSKFNKENINFLQVASKYNIPLEYSKDYIIDKKIKDLEDEDSISQLEKETFTNIFEQELKNNRRKDLSHLYACTIDGETAKDFDDAISLEVNKDTYRLFVHIADVSFFVEKGSTLDEEAYKRSTSYYLGSFVTPMLPNILSEELCSLRSQVKRLTVTCEMLFSKDLEIQETKLYRSIIFVDDRFTYTQAEKEMKISSSPLHKFYNFSKLLISRYSDEGKLDLSIAEISFQYDEKRDYEIINKKVLFAHKMIESFMLTANQHVAKFLKKKYNYAMYRIHKKMPDDNIDKINTFLKINGLDLRLQNGDVFELQSIFKALEQTDKVEMFPYILLRCFSQAVYGEKPFGHWGLNFTDYTHFTSPIRRYADLVVHRMITTEVSPIQRMLSKKIYSLKELKEVSGWISKQERVALEAERYMKKLQSLDFMEQHIGEEFVVFFAGFHGHGLFVLLMDWAIDLFILATDFGDLKTVQSKNDFQVFLPKYQKVITMGDKIRIKVMQIDKTRSNIQASIINLES